MFWANLDQEIAKKSFCHYRLLCSSSDICTERANLTDFPPLRVFGSSHTGDLLKPSAYELWIMQGFKMGPLTWLKTASSFHLWVHILGLSMKWQSCLGSRVLWVKLVHSTIKTAESRSILNEKRGKNQFFGFYCTLRWFWRGTNVVIRLSCSSTYHQIHWFGQKT